MHIISLRESTKGPGGEYLLVEWHHLPDHEINDTTKTKATIYYLSTKTMTCTLLKQEEIPKIFSFLRRKDDKAILMQAARFML